MRLSTSLSTRLLTLALAAAAPLAARSAPPAPPSHFVAPATLKLETGAPLPYENGFLLVPENRADPASRKIAVRYLRFPAQTSTPVPVPVVMLPGGPGSVIAEAALKRSPDTVETIRHAIRTRDFVILQQRGVVDGSYGSGLDYPNAALPLDKPASAADQRERLREGVRRGIAEWTGLGVDLRGYTALEMAADVEDLRRVLGVERIVLYGTSFGSQWSFSYLKLHQDRVERAVLTGLEPLDYAYDSPQGIWDTLKRIGAKAAASAELSAEFRDIDLAGLYQRVAERLERAPQRATIQRPDGKGTVEVVVGADDLRQVLYPVEGSLRDSTEAWPRLLLELDRGDYRYLAVLAYRNRQAGDDGLLSLLVDNSLGISARRETALNAEPARRWLGDINAGYVNTRDLTPTADVGDDFRADFELRIPMLLIQGDTDLSTPLENALSQLPQLRHGRVVVVEGGTHSVRREILTPELMQAAPGLGRSMLEFLAPTTDESAAAALARFPEHVALAPYRFAPMQAPSLYERWLAARAER